MNSYDSAWTLSKSNARGCYLAKLYFVSSGRNAFYSTWSEKYPGDDAFHISLESAKAEAEKKRVQGSQFFIDEIPALVFHITSWCLVITEINTAFPFQDYLRRTPASRKIFDIAVCFTSRRINTIQQLFCVYRDFTQPTSFHSYKSSSNGIHTELEWRQHSPKGYPVETKYAEATVKRLHRWILSQIPPR